MSTQQRLILFVLLVVVASAGCTSISQPSTPNPTLTTTDAPTPTATPSTEPATASPTTVASGPAEGTEWTVRITRVIDGDTMEAEFPNGETDTLRLLGVDTPETTFSRVDPTEFEGIPDTTAGRDHLFNWGEHATDFATNELAGKEVIVRVDPLADRRGSFGRLLVYVSVGGENFNERLLTEGYARVYPSTFSHRDEFESAEATARANQVGLWDFEGSTLTTTRSQAGDSLVVRAVHADAAGNDHQNLNDEFIVFENTGDSTLDLAGWTVADDADHTYTFPAGFDLEPDATVTLYTGNGMDMATAVYWGADAAIWNNGGDTIIVRDDQGTLVLQREY